MFTSKNAIEEITGVAVTGQTLATAHMMIEAYVGKPEVEITDAGDLELLAAATTFQAIYIRNQTLDIMEQVAIKSTTLGESTMSMNLELMAPFMSPFAVLSLNRLSWRRTRSIHTGPTFGVAPAMPVWEMD